MGHRVQKRNLLTLYYVVERIWERKYVRNSFLSGNTFQWKQNTRAKISDKKYKSCVIRFCGSWVADHITAILTIKAAMIVLHMKTSGLCSEIMWKMNFLQHRVPKTTCRKFDVNAFTIINLYTLLAWPKH